MIFIPHHFQEEILQSRFQYEIYPKSEYTRSKILKIQEKIFLILSINQKKISNKIEIKETRIEKKISQLGRILSKMRFNCLSRFKKESPQNYKFKSHLRTNN